MKKVSKYSIYEYIIDIKRATIVIIAIVLFSLLSSCSTSPEEQVAEYIAAAESNFEDRNAGDLKKLIAPSYSDSYGFTRQDVVRVLAGYFIRNPNTYVLTHIEELSFLQDSTLAQFTLHTALSQEDLTTTDLKLLDAEFYRVSGTLEKQGEWLLTSAQLARTTSDDFISSLEK